MGAGAATAGCVATDETVHHDQLSVVENATAAAGSAERVPWVGVAGVIIADGAVCQTQYSLIYVYPSSATAIAGSAATTGTIVCNCDLVQDRDREVN